MKNVKNVKSVLLMREIFVEKLSFERKAMIKAVDEDGKITFSSGIEKYKDESYKVKLGVVLQGDDNYFISVEMAGIFEIEEDTPIKKDILEVNTLAIIFPYLRSQLTLLTSQPGFTPIVLPAINIHALLRENK